MTSDTDLTHQSETLQQPFRSFKPLKLTTIISTVILITIVAGTGGYLLGSRNAQSISLSQPSPSPQTAMITQTTATITHPAHNQPISTPNTSITLSADVPTVTANPTSWKTYRSQKYGFTIQYPPDWKILKSGIDIDEIVIASLQNTITISVFDFRSSAYATFQSWVDERPYALIELKGRRVLRWYTSGVNISRTEVALIPSKDEDWAVFIHLAMHNKNAPSNSNYVRIFDQMVASLNF